MLFIERLNKVTVIKKIGIAMVTNNRTLDEFLATTGDIERESYVQRLLNLEMFDENDWTFKNANTKEFTHVIFSEYPARMIPQIARKLIKLYYPKYEKPDEKKPILDPFAGSGTTAVEALLRNIDSITFDLNPLANMIQKVKTTVVSPNKIRKKYIEILREIEHNKNRTFPEFIPKKETINYWYNKKVIKDLTVVRYAIEQVFSNKKNSEEEQNIKEFFLLCFGKTARICSYQRLGEHKTYRIPKSKIKEFDAKTDVFKTFKKVYAEFFQGKKDLYNYYTKNNFNAKCTTVLGDSRKLEGVKENSVDLIVTSPPYGDSHTTVAYGQFSRFPLEWINIKCDEINQIDNRLLGGIKKDSILISSPTLFETCKKILTQQITQQVESFRNSLNNIKGQYNNTLNSLQNKKSILEEIEQYMSDLLKILDEAKKLEQFAELTNLKNKYLQLSRKIKSLYNTLFKEIKKATKSSKIKGPKLYEDRLGYVISFFADLLQVFERLYSVLDYNRYCCIVIGNRTVKGVKILNDKIIPELGNHLGFEHVTTYYRIIPNKRMPKKNSPTNIKGETVSTIEKESIIILKKVKK